VNLGRSLAEANGFIKLTECLEIFPSNEAPMYSPPNTTVKVIYKSLVFFTLVHAVMFLKRIRKCSTDSSS
jgi:hypothetical protein